MTEYPAFMALHGEQLIDNGYRILPIIPGKKVPGRYQGGTWTPSPDWSRHCDRPTKPFEHDIWRRWPECAVGLACGTVVGIDIDVMDADVAFGLERLAREMLGDTPALRIGKAPKRSLYYRTADPFQGKKLHPLEVLARGNQSVIYGIHPDTGLPYEWPEESLVDLDISRLPLITEQQAMAWLDEAYKRTPIEFKPASTLSSLTNGDVSAWHGPSDPIGTYEAIKSALEFIPNDDVDGSSWIRVGNAIKAALGEKGRDLWLDWSKSSGKSGSSGKTDTAERRWHTARPTKVGAGTIYWLAEQRGWVPDSELVLNGSEAEADGEIHPAAGLIAKASMLSRMRKSGTPDPSIIDPIIMDGLDGFLKEFVDYTTDTAYSPQPFHALAAAMCAVGAAAGRRYRSLTNFRTNIMVIALADSGGGKDRPLKCLTNAFIDAGLEEYLGGNKIASGSALLTAVRDHPVQLFPLDELGHVMSNNTAKGAGAHKGEILPLLTELFSKAGDVHLGTNYGDSKTNPRSVTHQPHIVLYGATVAHILWGAFGNAAKSDGSLARYLLFRSWENYPDPNEDITTTDTPESIIHHLQMISGTNAPGGTGNLAGLRRPRMTASEKVKAVVVDETPSAQIALRSRSQEQLGLLRQHEGTPNTAFLARLREHTVKAAMIKAISRDYANPIISEDDVRWSNALIDHCLRDMMGDADRYVSDNATHANHLAILDIIRKAGTISGRDFARKTQGIETRVKNEIIASLVESGQIIKLATNNGKQGRNPISYAAVTA